MGWRNRIVGYGEKPAGDFLANPANWRIHTQDQQAALDGLLTEVGWVQSVVENVRTGNLVDGHMRVLEALKHGDDTPVPFVAVDLSLDEEQKILAALDPIAAMAKGDGVKLHDLLQDISTASQGLQSLLSDLAKDHAIAAGSEPTEPEPEACPTCGYKKRRKKS